MNHHERTAAKYSVEVSEDGDTVVITLRRWEATALARVLLNAIEQFPLQSRERSRLRGVARTIIARTRPKKQPKYRQNKVERPPNGYRSEFDIDHVLNGSAPYPVLSFEDMHEVYPLLEQRGLTAKEIAARVYVSSRTVVRWRRETRKGMEKG